jgi:hypothetical protein
MAEGNGTFLFTLDRLTQPALQSAERRRNMLSAQGLAALNRRLTFAIGQTCENGRD